MNEHRTQSAVLGEERLRFRSGGGDELRVGTHIPVGAAANPQPFRVLEEEQLVLHLVGDRSADGIAELVASEYRLRHADGVVIEILGGQTGVTAELISRTVEVGRFRSS